MRLAIGDDVGQVKIIDTTRGIDTTLPTSARAKTTSHLTPSRHTPIQRLLTLSSYGDASPALAAASRGGLIRILDPSASPLAPAVLLTHQIPGAGADDDIVALAPTPESAAPGLAAVTSTGIVAFVALGGGGGGGSSAAAVAGPVSAAAVSADGERVLVGGPGRELEAYARAAGGGAWTSVWRARNVKPSALRLAVPVHPTAVRLLPAAPGSLRFLAGSRAGHLRLYDTAVSRRPVWSLDWPETRALTNIALLPRSPLPDARLPLVEAPGDPPGSAKLRAHLNVVLTDNAGWFGVYALRERRHVGVFTEATGAVLGVAACGGGEEAGGLVVGTGFDRYVFAYDAESRKLASRVYVKTQGLCVAVLEAADAAEEGEKEADSREDSEEEVWGGMEEVAGDDEDDEEGDEDEEDESGDEVTKSLMSTTKRRPRPRPATEEETGREKGGKKRRVR